MRESDWMDAPVRSRASSESQGWFTAAVVVIVFLFIFLLATAANAQDESSCEACHSNAEWFDEPSLAIVKGYATDVHAAAGLSCHDCHGGNPEPALAEDMTAAMDDSWSANPYRGVPDRKDIPQLCGRCHSNPSYMRRFDPDPRVGQLEEYWLSQHGIALRTGDTSVATCTDCHGVHGIREVDDPESRVHPRKLADMCGECHSDPERMAGRIDPRGNPLPVNQVSRWKRSVHAAAMYDKGDLTAPTCNDCHGNHGATPPGFDSITFVCGQCHGRETELFRTSVKQDAFATHNEYLLDADEGCATCHENPGSVMRQINHFSECSTCHDNHAVVRPTIALLGQLPDTPCAFCHEPKNGLAAAVGEPGMVAENFANVRDTLLSTAASRELTGDERFDWLVDQALVLPNHTVASGAEEGEEKLRPEFARLFQKFRIGKTRFTYDDPVTGEEVVEQIRQCTGCHSDPESTGLTTAREQLDAIWELIGSIARSERILLAAQRGGVEVRSAHADLDAAIDSAIELEVLIHSFNTRGDFEKKRKEGLLHASNTLAAGRESLDELAYRRRGLGIAIIIIVLVLAALAFKIRAIGGP